MTTNLLIPVDLIEIGCTVFALNSDRTDADMRAVKGGTVVAIATGATSDGELQRKFITATPWRNEIRFDELLAEHVDQADPPNTAAMRTLIRTAAAVVAKAKRVGSAEARCIQLQHDLMEALA